MSRRFAVSLPALALIVAAGCGRSDKTETTSSVGANTPTVSGSTVSSGENDSSTNAPGPVTYASAESAFKSGDYPAATELFTRYTQSNPDNAWGFYMLGVSAWKKGEPKNALEAFDRALQIDPDHQKSLFNSSRVLLDMNRPLQALKRIEQALGREPMSNEGLRLLGRARYQSGEVDEAIDAYRKALAVDPNDVWSMNNLALIYLDQDRGQEAIPPLARAVEVRTHAPVFQNNLGMALERSGYPAAAAKAYETAIALDSSYQKASVGLSRVTGGGQTPEESPVDLSRLSQQFQDEISSWQSESPVDSTVTEPVNDSTSGASHDSQSSSVDSSPALGISDSAPASVEAVSDSVEDCEQD
jgi:predicted Zn-dependent protease